MKLYRADWIFPIESPPVEGGALLVSGDRILALGGAKELVAANQGAELVDCGGRGLMPALVNGHAHLELTDLGGVIDAPSFGGWVLEVIRRKRATSDEAFARSAGAGLVQCAANGQGVVADVVSVPGGAAGYDPDLGVDLRIFPELIATSPANVGEGIERVSRIVETMDALDLDAAGLSPHSPYTVCSDGYRVALAATGVGGRWMTHLAETGDEVDFCMGLGTSIAKELYAKIPVNPPEVVGKHPVEMLDCLGLLDERSVLVHLCAVEDSHVETLRRRNANVVLCPRSNRALSTGPAPGRSLLDAGLSVGLGTDSVLSSGDLDLWGEMEAAVDDYGWSPAEAIRAATLGGARVLGIGEQSGAFAPGRPAAILAVELGDGDDPYEKLLDGRKRGVERVGLVRMGRG